MADNWGRTLEYLDGSLPFTQGADRLGVLGNCKVFAKDSLKFAPIIGGARPLLMPLRLGLGHV